MKRNVILILVLCLLLTSFSACGKRGGLDDSETTLNIYSLEAGYGIKFLDEYKKLFEEENPGTTVKYKTTTEAYTKFIEDIKLGPAKNGYDLYLAPNFNYQLVMSQTKVPGYSDCYLDLSSLYDEKIPGENVTIREKMFSTVASNTYYDNKQYFVPWAGGPSGFIYNADILTDDMVPRTTNQLLSVTSKTYSTEKNSKVYGLMTSENGHGYWEYIGDTWWAQLEGVKGYNEFYNLGDGSAINFDAYYSDGYRRNFELIEELINKSEMYPRCTAMPHTQAQMYFLEGKAVMMPCGNWLEAEMNENFSGEQMNFKMMKTPVISDLANPDKLNLPGSNAEERDAKLVEVIDYIDNGETGDKPSGVSDFQISIVRNARNIVYDIGLNHILLIPSYSNAIPLAKKFIQMMASDKGIKAFSDITHTTTCYKYDYSAQNYSTLYNSYLKIYNENTTSICANPYAIKERVANSFAKFNFDIYAYRDLQLGEITAKQLVEGEIKKAEEKIPTWG